MSDGRDFAARYVLYGAGEMSKSQRENIADWLREAADSLVAQGFNYSKRFVGKYHVRRPKA